MFTINDLAKLMRLSPSTVKTLLRTGAIVSVKVGHLRRVRRSDYLAYVEP
jgi:excisionase family DNA binding protein